ncbi:MAG TPA: patatin-like phospholipase family protein, partial [Candidatus Binatia bacterium]|nr:patatin-like phospholipase family protein [Candidatus Binatia bacterium]
MYRIISFDGGGIRGLVTLAMLKRLEAQVPNLIANADMLAGTSTGGIIALGLAAGKSVDDLISLYRDNGKDIFDDSWLDDLRDLGGISGADYDQKNLGKILKRIFQNTKLKDLSKRVLIPSFDLDNEAKDASKRTWSPKFFHNFPGKDTDGNELVVDVALDTSAAPTYFPSHNGYIDGGVVANNPSLAAVAQTQDKRNSE